MFQWETGSNESVIKDDFLSTIGSRTGMREQGRVQSLNTNELLSTKLAPPRPRSSLVRREALLARLDEGLEHKLTLVSAPAGFGKTTLVSEWIASCGERQDSPSVAWVSLDEGDNDPTRFWRYIITACQAFDAPVGESALALLLTSRRLSLEAVLTTFINELAQSAHGGVLILEDYHVITSPQIHETLTYLVDHLPSTLHLLVLTRSDPPLPLARLRAHDDLYELHAADMRFSLSETQTFLRQAIPFPLSTEVITRLEARTEGWAVGLRLLALALQGREDFQDIEHMLVTFTGSHKHILEYLVADVLSSQSQEAQEFLLQTAFLKRLTGSLCNAVTGRPDGEQMLKRLERANLFLIPLDDAGQWYRYHALFAEAMQHEAGRRFEGAYMRSRYDRASLWFEQHGLLPEATEVALTARDFVRAAALIERIIVPHGIKNELHTLSRWIGQLPEDILQAHPDLCLAYAATLLFTLDRSDPATLKLILKPLEAAEHYWQVRSNAAKLGEALAFHSQVAWWQGDLSQAFATARQALELSSGQETLWSVSGILIIALEDLLAGKPERARHIALEALAGFEAANNTFGARAAIYLLGETYSWQGKLHTAADLYRQLFAEASEDPLDKANALIGLAAVSYEENELQKAEQQLLQTLDLGKHHRDEIGSYHAEQFILVPASLVLARVLHARGEVEQAEQLLHRLAILTQERKWSYLYREVLAFQARLSLATGDLAAVQRWSTTIAHSGEDIRPVQQEREALIVARLLIAQGEITAALRLLERWRIEAQTWERTRSTMQIQVLTALAHLANKDLLNARQALTEALVLAQVEGYQRLFLDEGEALLPVLRAILLDEPEQALLTYVRNLMAALAHHEVKQITSHHASPALLIEPLSPQEQRVLRLLAAGRSNPEIAQELIVSVNTVKTQVQSIYRKLNVKNRWEAREAARALKLL
jgi:LuxR family transcriptional regulator, maltose regulon positive regulatory protein